MTEEPEIYDIISRKESFRDFENICRTKTGKQIWVSTNGSPLFDKGGNLTGYRGFDIDITDKISAQRKAQERASLLSCLMKSMPDIVFVKDKEGKYLECNPEFCSLVRRDENEVIGYTDYDFFDKETADFFRSKDLLAMEEGTQQQNQESINHPDGRLLHLETIKSPLKDEAGRVIGVVGIGRDITEKKQANTQLIESENKYRNLVEASKDAVFVNQDYKITYINKAGSRLFGANSPDELVGKSPLMLIDADQRDMIKRRVEHLEQTGEVVYVDDEKINTLDGKQIYVETIASPFQDKGKFAIHVVMRDITKRKENEAKIINQAKRLEAILQTLPDMLFVMGADGVYLDYYASGNTDLAIERDKVIGTNIRDTFDNEQSERHLSHIKECIQTGNFIRYEYGMHINGQQRWYAARMVKFGNEKVLVTVINITDRMEAQEQLAIALEKAEKMALEAETANNAKSLFLANMSHELRTPLNAILGFSQILSNERLTPKQSGFVDIIQNQGDNLLELVNTILDFTAIEQGQLQLHIRKVRLKDLTSKLESAFLPTASSKKLEFNVNVSDDLPEEFNTDFGRVFQCLVNLAGNAIKFTEKGEVCVRAGLFEDENKRYVRFDICDTGVGITTDKKDMIYEFFTQADFSHTRKYGGIGLGIPITKKLAVMLGGKLSFETKQGKGSVFSLFIPLDVKLPAPKKDISKKQPANIPAQPRLQGKVLVVEDSPVNQKVLQIILESFGFEVHLAANGASALEQTEQQQFTLIFMDIQMPKMNGYDATREIRRRGIDTPIIAVTAAATKQDEENCFDVGCSWFLSKPIDRKGLLEAILKFIKPNA